MEGFDPVSQERALVRSPTLTITIQIQYAFCWSTVQKRSQRVSTNTALLLTQSSANESTENFDHCLLTKTNMEAHDGDGCISLMIATSRGNLASIGILIKHDAIGSAKDTTRSHTALPRVSASAETVGNGIHLAINRAAEEGRAELFSWPPSAQAALDCAHQAALHEASNGDQDPMVLLQIDRGAVTEVRDDAGNMNLLIAVE